MIFFLDGATSSSYRENYDDDDDDDYDYDSDEDETSSEEDEDKWNIYYNVFLICITRIRHNNMNIWCC